MRQLALISDDHIANSSDPAMVVVLRKWWLRKLFEPNGAEGLAKTVPPDVIVDGIKELTTSGELRKWTRWRRLTADPIEQDSQAVITCLILRTALRKLVQVARGEQVEANDMLPAMTR